MDRWRARRRGTDAVASVLAVACLYAGYLCLPAAAAKFTSTATPAGSSFGSGTVVISDDDSGSSLFTSDLVTTSTSVTSCIAVSYTGTATSAVKLYATVGGDSGVQQYATLKIEEGTGGSSSSCTGFSASSTLFNTTLNTWAATSYAAGLSSWTPSSSATKTYRFTLSLNAATPIAQQGSQITLAITWEARAGS